MISFKSRCKIFQDADRITRMTKTVYPHISESMSGLRIYGQMPKCKDFDDVRGLSRLRLKNSIKIDNLRHRGRYGISCFRNIIDMLKNYKIGNCYEEAILCEIIGKINGLKNIYHCKIVFNRNSSGAQMELDHAISVLSKKTLNEKELYNFNNKDAVILDPWLGITEFAQDYFTRLKNEFSKLFPLLPDNQLSVRKAKISSKTPKEYHDVMKTLFKPDFYIKIHDGEILSDSDTKILKKEFPELVIQK